jgi:hypothetical protein
MLHAYTCGCRPAGTTGHGLLEGGRAHLPAHWARLFPLSVPISLVASVLQLAVAHPRRRRRWRCAKRTLAGCYLHMMARGVNGWLLVRVAVGGPRGVNGVAPATRAP